MLDGLFNPIDMPLKNPVCPSCGYCSHCGHSPPYNPNLPWAFPGFTTDVPQTTSGFFTTETQDEN